MISHFQSRKTESKVTKNVKYNTIALLYMML